MNAKQARELMGVPKNDELERIYECIKAHLKMDNKTKGMTCSVELLSQSGADFLKDVDGYEVERIDDWRDGDYFRICWGK